MERIKTGITGLDKKLGGGFPAGSSILLVGPPGCGKSTISQQFLAEGLKNEEAGLYTTLDIPPEEFLENIKKFGKVNTKNLKFIDAYSWRIGNTSGDFTLTNLANINELNIMMSQIIEEIGPSKLKRSVFDSVSTLLLYADPILVVKMMPVIIAKLKAAKFTQILILEEGVHDPKTVATLNYLTDGLIEFKMEEGKRFFRIVRMKDTDHKMDWVEFDITDQGVQI
ncbi:MAG: hypothetical protein KJ697_04365 [Nanoarchaeota archaeon]|nr:hypothetical protein [Nanoarchaeota archaeon]MBU4123918.1 hypothetical protein [Nanoarchaeota archaeon]